MSEQNISERQSKEYSINDWARALRSVDTQLADTLDEDRELGYQNIERLDLPHQKRVRLLLSEFVRNPTEVLDSMNVQKFHISITAAQSPDFKRIRRSDLTRDEVLELAKQVPPEHIQECTINILEYRENLYGGSVVVNDDGKMLLEMRRGYQGPIANGSETPEFTLERDRFTDSFKYSFDDEDLRKVVFNKVVLSIPHSGEGREMKFTPGYYEFVLTQKEDSKELQAWFLDYKENKAYQLP